MSRLPAVCQPRFEVTVPILYGAPSTRPGREDAGWTHDLSVSGAALDLPEPLPIRTWLSLHVLLGSQRVRVHAGVVWTRQLVTDLVLFRHGVTFAPLGAEGNALLAAFFQETTPVPTRIPVPGAINAVVQATIDARVIDLSLAGACLEHDRPLRPESDSRLTLITADTRFSLSAHILRSSVDRVDRPSTGDRDIVYRTGVRFEAGAAGHQQTLRELIAQLRDQQRAAQ